MLDYTEVRRIFESYLKTYFTTCKIKFENVPLDTSELLEWIAIFDKPISAESTGMQETTALTTGVLIIQIFTPIDTGTERSREIAEILATLLGDENLSGISLATPELHNASPDPSFFQQNLIVPYSLVMGQTETC